MSSTMPRKRKRSDVAETSSFGATPGPKGAPQPFRERRQEEEGHSQGQRDGAGYWSHCAAQDNARVHYGHTYVQNHHSVGRRDILQEDKVELFIQALKFGHMDSRCDSIDPAHVNTCRWLFQKEQYLIWSDPQYHYQHRGFLWIKGKAGTGKSTLMKCAFEHAKSTPNADSVIAFFFNARGHDLEKSVEGMYRALLCQALVQFPNIRAKFRTTVPQSLEQQSFSIPVMRNYFRKAVSFLESHEAMTIYVDALDECDEEEIREAIESFEEVGMMAHSKGSMLNLCFASRYYPQITIAHCVEIELEAQVEHQQDIDTYIDNKLSIRDPMLHSQLAKGIRQQCSGVFFWVVLVIRMLKRKSDRGAGNSEMLRTLSEIPLKLRELIASILEAPDDILLATMQWMIFARVELSLPELYFAIRTSAGQLVSGEWDRTEVDPETMKSFVLASSRGLVEVDPRPQLIHESVREYLLADGLATIEGRGFDAHRTMALGHARISEWCQTYVRLDLETYLAYRSNVEDYKGLDDCGIHREEDRSYLIDAYPLLPYSVGNVFYHLEIAHDAGELDLYSLRDFPNACWAVLTWLVGDTALEMQGVPMLRDDPTTLLYILVVNRCSDLLTAILEADAAFSWRDHKHMSVRGRPHGIFARKLNLNVRFEGLCGTECQSLLERAVVVGSYDIAHSLLLHGADANICSGQALCGAVLRRDAVTSGLLLEYGASPDAHGVNPEGESALTLAARLGDLKLVHLLLTCGANPKGANNVSAANPLLGALGYGYDENGHDTHDQGMNHYDMPGDNEGLHYLEEDPTDLTIIKALLVHGAEVNQEAKSGLTPLKYAAGHQTPAILNLLLEQGQQNDVTLSELVTCAAQNLNAEVLQFLLPGLSTDTRHFAAKDALQILSTAWSPWKFSRYSDNDRTTRDVLLSVVRLLLAAQSGLVYEWGEREKIMLGLRMKFAMMSRNWSRDSGSIRYCQDHDHARC
jgi:ankyrin repeat protein